MPPTKTKRPRRKPTAPPVPPAANSADEILTLAEAAAYLRVPESALHPMLIQQAIPGRKIGSEWRFLKAALQDWLRSSPSTASKKGFWEIQGGAFPNDPFLEEIAREAYRKRGRPMIEEV